MLNSYYSQLEIQLFMNFATKAATSLGSIFLSGAMTLHHCMYRVITQGSEKSMEIGCKKIFVVQYQKGNILVSFKEIFIF